jgi:hypothetical protein
MSASGGRATRGVLSEVYNFRLSTLAAGIEEAEAQQEMWVLVEDWSGASDA